MSLAETDSNTEVLIQGLMQCGKYFHERGWSLGTSSNYSAVCGRDPLEILITASGKHKDRLAPDDFVKVDQNGMPTVENQPKSAAETLLHCLMETDENVGAVLHTHSIWSTILSEQFFENGQFEISGFEMQKGLEGIKTHESTVRVPIFENTQDIPALAREVEAYISNNPPIHGYLIRRHGLYTWGVDLDQARRHVEVFEFLFEAIARRQMLQSTH